MENCSPLRYPGGKSRLARYIGTLIELNDTSGGTYIEPFAGGAGVALSLLFSEHVKKIHINDLDKRIYAFWHSVLYETEALLKLIYDTPVTIENWRFHRQRMFNPERFSELELGFSAFYSNRSNRSGILNGGVIGGIEQKGVWKIDARYNKKDLINRIQKIALFANRIAVSNLEACSFLSENLKNYGQKTFIYLDPPYYIKGDGLYHNHFKHEDHAVLAEVVKRIVNHKWVISYDNVPQIKSLYQNFRQEEFGINYSAKDHYRGSEVMIFQHGLISPDKVFTSKKEETHLNNILMGNIA